MSTAKDKREELTKLSSRSFTWNDTLYDVKEPTMEQMLESVAKMSVPDLARGVLVSYCVHFKGERVFENTAQVFKMGVTNGPKFVKEVMDTLKNFEVTLELPKEIREELLKKDA